MRMRSSSSFVVVVLTPLSCVLIHIIIRVDASPFESKLYNDLLSDYVIEERPVASSHDAVDVRMTVYVQQLIALKEKEEQLEVNAWLKYEWRDDNLRWDPKKYGGLESLRHPAGSIWHPDILLYNSVDANFDSTFKVNMMNRFTGDVEWTPPGIFKVACKLDIYWFPFDQQTCFFKFGSWTYDMSKINVVNTSIDLSELMPNGEWNILASWSTVAEKHYACCPEGYQEVLFYLKLQRRTLYYAYSLILPCFLTMVLVILGFYLPPESSEKVGLQISVALAITIFLTILNEMVPPTSEAVPILGIFFQCCMVISIAATAFTVYVQCFHLRSHDNHDRMGEWMSYLLLDVSPWLLRMTLPKRPNSFKSLIAKRREISAAKSPETVDRLERVGGLLHQTVDGFLTQLKRGSSSSDRLAIQRVQLLERIYEHVRLIRVHDESAVEESVVRFEWRVAAMVVDRASLLAFFSLFVTTCLVLALRAPYLVA